MLWYLWGELVLARSLAIILFRTAFESESWVVKQSGTSWHINESKSNPRCLVLAAITTTRASRWAHGMYGDLCTETDQTLKERTARASGPTIPSRCRWFVYWFHAAPECDRLSFRAPRTERYPRFPAAQLGAVRKAKHIWRVAREKMQLSDFYILSIRLMNRDPLTKCTDIRPVIGTGYWLVFIDTSDSWIVTGIVRINSRFGRHFLSSRGTTGK